jgi:hypothetical protein
MECINHYRRSHGVSDGTWRRAQWGILPVAVVVVAVAWQNLDSIYTTYTQLVDSGWCWDIGVRIKALFIKHTKTGNPLVDSVAEHGSTPASFYETYLHHVYHYAPLGLPLCLAPLSALGFRSNVEVSEVIRPLH